MAELSKPAQSMSLLTFNKSHIYLCMTLTSPLHEREPFHVPLSIFSPQLTGVGDDYESNVISLSLSLLKEMKRKGGLHAMQLVPFDLMIRKRILARGNGVYILLETRNSAKGAYRIEFYEDFD